MHAEFCPEDTPVLLEDFGLPVQVDGGPTSLGRIRSRLEVLRLQVLEVPHGLDVLTIVRGSLGALCTDQRIWVAATPTGDPKAGTVYRFRQEGEGERGRYAHLLVAAEEVAP